MSHLDDRKTSYWKHFYFAFGAGIVLLLAGLASIVHAILPNVLTGYSEKKVHALSRLSKWRRNEY